MSAKPTVELSGLRDRILACSTRDAVTGCWLWRGRLDKSGYGIARIGSGRATTAHRASYFAFVGDIADGLEVDHLCFQTACVNPSHLRLLPASVNASLQRKALSATCARGHEFTPENTFWQKNRRSRGADVHRLCRECRRQGDRRRRAAA
jgi:hypothetical protein